MDSESFFKGFWTAVKLGRHFVMGLISKFITRNGTYIAANDGADGYSTVTVDVTPEFTAADEGKVVDNGALVAQTSRNIDANGTYDTTLNNSVVVNVSGGGGGSTILSGAEDPTSSVGENGNIYLKYASLPSGVTRLESITANGAQWLQTNYALNSNSVFEIETNVATRNATYATIFGRPGGSTQAWLISHINGSPNLTAAWGGTDIRSNQYNITGRLVRIRYSRGHVYVTETDGTVVCDWYPNAGSNYDATNLFLFSQGANNNCIKATLKKFAIIENGMTVRDFVPILDANGVACFYEIVTQRYFYNQGSGAFTAGNISTEPCNDMIVAAYAKVNGVWQPLIGTNISDVTH